jgi:hypothetical protein
MRLERYILMSLIFVSAVSAILFWRKAAVFEAENEKLRAEIAELEEGLTTSTNSISKMVAEVEAIRKQKSELMTLRNDVTQLRNATKNNESLGAELQRLKAENQQLRASAQAAQGSQVQPLSRFAGQDHFTRETWAFAGYGSPEEALVSAIWAMKEGNPKTYMESLSPQEQQRLSESWKNKSEQEIAQKHQSDVSQITGLRILDRQPGGTPGEVLLSVYLEGQHQLHTVRMNQNGQDWKFGGFVRPQIQPAAQP